MQQNGFLPIGQGFVQRVACGKAAREIRYEDSIGMLRITRLNRHAVSC
jgi:hypothetical protein